MNECPQNFLAIPKGHYTFFWGVLNSFEGVEALINHIICIYIYICSTFSPLVTWGRDQEKNPNATTTFGGKTLTENCEINKN